MKDLYYENFCSNCHSQFTTAMKTNCIYCDSEVRAFPFIICECGGRIYLQQDINICTNCRKGYDRNGNTVKVFTAMS